MSAKLKAIHTHALDFWFARSSIVVVAALQLLVINKLAIGPQWLGPALEIALLIPLSMATAWTQGQARDATHDHHWHLVAQWRRFVRRLAVALTALVTIMNTGALVLLIKALLSGHTGDTGQSLLLDAVNIWTTNVIAFTLWFWSIDRGGPAARGITHCELEDFLFPPMTIEKCKDWSPNFADYLYLSFTNATAFSPTDTLPLTSRAKMLMMAESAISLLTIALVAARAVNILA